MSEPRKLTRAELEYYVSAKPRTEKLPGFFDEAGKLHRGAYYLAYLGKKGVGSDNGTRICGYYVLRSEALEGAKIFQAKCRELLDAGDYA